MNGIKQQPESDVSGNRRARCGAEEFDLLGREPILPVGGNRGRAGPPRYESSYRACLAALLRRCAANPASGTRQWHKMVTAPFTLTRRDTRERRAGIG